MPLVLADRVRDTTTTTGTGTVTLSGTAPTGYQNFSVIGNGNTTYYTINAGSQWEVGIGTYSSAGPTLARTTVLESSNGGALVNFSAGVKDVFVTYPADEVVIQDGATIAAGTAVLGVANGGTGATAAAGARTNLGATTVGGNFFTLANPTAITFPRINADNTVSALSAADFRTAIGAGTGSGTVTSVAASGGTTGLTFSGSPITTSGIITMGGTLGVANGGTGVTTSTGTGSVVLSNSPTLVTPTLGAASATSIANGLGAVGTPSYTFTGDTNTGMWSPAADTIAFSEGGVEAMRLDASGRLLIGTTTGVGNDFVSIRFNSASSFPQGLNMVDSNASASGTNFQVFRRSDDTYLGNIRRNSTDNAIYVGGNSYLALGSGDTERMRIDSSGNVGIGTTNPAGWRLRVEKADAQHISLLNTAGDGTRINMADQFWQAEIEQNAGNLLFKTGGTTERARITSGGNLLIGTTVNYSRLTVSNGNSTRSGITISDANTASLMMFAGASSNAVIAIDTNSLVFKTGATAGQDNGTDRLTINSAGNVTANVDFRAPIFYDSNNTAFYVDPAAGGTSANFASTVVIGGSYARSLAHQGYLNGQYGTVSSNSTVNPIYCISGGFAPSSATNLGNMYGIGYTDGGQSGVWAGGGWGMYVADNGNVRHFLDASTGIGYATASYRAPIFFDSNNTAFYVDPAGNSILSTLRASNIQFPSGTVAINLDNSSYSIFRSPDGGIRMYLGGADPANYYDNDAHIFRNRATTQLASITGSGVFAPIYYDSNNTAYYVDPTSMSVLTNVTYGPFPGGGGGGGRLIVGPGSPYSLRQEFGSDNSGWRYGVAKNVNGAVTDLFYVQDNGAVVSLGDMRAPIFYDSNNTAFYTDPASTSVMNIVNLSRINMANSNSVYADGDGNAGWRFGGTGYVYLNQAGLTYAQTAIVARGGVSNDSAGLLTLLGGTSGGTQINTDTRSPIYYDLNNTAFYLDAAANSVLNTLSVSANDTSSGGGVAFGGTASAQFIRGRNSDGASSTLSNLQLQSWFGIGFGPSISGQLVPIGENAAWIDCRNGDLYGRRLVIAGQDMRAPLYYDSQNTGYYLDPTSNTSLRTVGDWRSDSAPWTGEFNGKIQYHASNWYFQAAGGWEFRRSDAVNAFSVNQVGFGTFRSNLRVGSSENASTIHMGDADEGERLIHCNSNRIGFLNQSSGWGSWCTDGGDWQSDTAVWAPIFYDLNDSSYYLNLNGYSQVNGNGSVNGSNTTGLNIFSVSGNGAIMAFHRGGHFAINMGLDSDNVFRMGGWSAAANRLQMDMSGNLTMAGNVTAYSDARLKRDVETIDGALDLVSKMRGVRFTRIENDERGVGVIAQEMLEVVPEVVQQGIGDDDTLSVAYGNLVGVLIEAIKELRAEVAELKGK